MSVYTMLGVLGVVLVLVLLLMTWALCVASGMSDDAMDATARAAAVRQQMRDRALAALGDDDEVA